MGSDLFGSFAESTCAALVVMASTPDLAKDEYLLYPLMISAVGIIACFFTSIYGIYFYKVDEVTKIEKALKIQLLISTILVLIGLIWIGEKYLPAVWSMDGAVCYWWYSVVCAGFGLIGGFLIGMSTDYYTSNAHLPV